MGNELSELIEPWWELHRDLGRAGILLFLVNFLLAGVFAFWVTWVLGRGFWGIAAFVLAFLVLSVVTLLPASWLARKRSKRPGKF
jgi:Na+/melibiose symporter-like transporter